MRRGWRQVWLIGLAGLLLSTAGLADEPLTRLEQDGFDHYTLALTWHAGFCSTRSDPPRECRDASLREGVSQGFVLHGLWPSLPERFARQGIDRQRWWQEGCFLEQPRADGSFCRAHPPFDLEEELAVTLNRAMPGRASCLDRYQFAKHAACLDLPEQAYFAMSVRLVDRVNDSAFGAFVALNQGGEVGRNDLIGAFEAAFGEGAGRALRLECRGRGNRTLTEVRIGIAADRLQDFPHGESFVRQERGRCATRVTIATFD
ncbi:ribonuclease T2 family protein [Billgrantia endophytica]|uniref:Ribonuclease I n=1 Tax=Billgrantia endophytica TaxID=2033802 RepID=A0A2N7U9K2_9GAMM|nr:ribonuclease I [Halomonas endophytica]PMR77119.1 ribonuclease I [Halomonas endophytica]